ncbi:MAG: 6,7-dimethyl-8-ribityllumazine synthase [Steroidobacteraceae bacterium]
MPGLDASGAKVHVVAARFNDEIVERLLQGATQTWQRLGGRADGLLVSRVPGAFELPVAASAIARRYAPDAIVALGCVIRGDTAHFEYVAGQCAAGLMRVSLDSGVPVIFGVLTVDTFEQAAARAQPGEGNKGGEAMAAAIEMMQVLRKT